jgi:hypothetical protein
MLSLISSGLLSLLEKELVAMEPELQTMLMTELSKISGQLMDFVNAKVGIPAPTSGDTNA